MIDAAPAGLAAAEPLDVEALFLRHNTELVRLASLLAGDRGRAEEIVQDAFLGLYRRSRSLGEPHAALGYLRRSVVNGVRSHQRRQRVAGRFLPPRQQTVAPAEDGALDGARVTTVLSAIATLPLRQRACIVLRYYEGLSDSEVAATLGIAAGSVKTHLSRARAALSTRLGDET
ncbi:MAG: SigE family RNA polymerase sigma factor [Acidimicrobiia bacterium]|nr:SigE family RNA polymerase sigma factor [Acidimicrobiia bacterium]